jgi:hypothetical protein
MVDVPGSKPYQFSLRSLLGVMTVFCVLLSLVTWLGYGGTAVGFLVLGCWLAVRGGRLRGDPLCFPRRPLPIRLGGTLLIVLGTLLVVYAPWIPFARKSWAVVLFGPALLPMGFIGMVAACWSVIFAMVVFGLSLLVTLVVSGWLATRFENYEDRTGYLVPIMFFLFSLCQAVLLYGLSSALDLSHFSLG